MTGSCPLYCPVEITAIRMEMKKMSKCGKENKNISCDAKNCVYHTTDCGCTAEAIKVSNKDACRCSETCCATFQMKKSDNTVI